MLTNTTKQKLRQLGLSTLAQTDYGQMLTELLGNLSKLPLPAVVGISGAQGSGKSTLAALLAVELQALGIRAQAVSLDDYYLGTNARLQLAKQVHPLLAQRGVPGSHDIQQALEDAHAVLAKKPVKLPVFDKGSDDRLNDLAATQLDLLIVEGWCLGVSAQDDVELLQPLNKLEAEEDTDGRWRHYVNQQLTGSYADYWRLLQPLVWLKAPDWESICRWRAKQEQQLWQERGTGMSERELSRFMLPFQRLTQASFQQLPLRADYTVQLDLNQQPVAVVSKELI